MEKKPVIALTSIAPSIAIWLYRAKDFSSRDGCLGKAADTDAVGISITILVIGRPV